MGLDRCMAALVLTRCVCASFSITVFLTNINVTTLPVEAYSYIRDIDDPTVAAMATLLILMSVGLVSMLEWLLGLDRFLDMS